MATAAPKNLPKNVVSVSQLRDHPAFRQIVVLAGIALAVAGGLWGYRWSQQPGYAPLYSGMSDVDSAAAADALRSSAIPFQLDPGTGVVMVPQAQLHEARLKLAAQGLPQSGGGGFETIQGDQGFGTSQFIENARYQHALETELARTISSLQPVRAARVHLAIPKPSAFARSAGAPSASVLIDLHAGRQLEQNQVASIVHMVASSVPGMMPGGVTVIDQFGRLLSNTDGNEASARSAEQFDHQRRVETDYVRRIAELLTPMVGPNRVSSQVAATIDFSETEEARESYVPDAAKIRSEQLVEDTRKNSAAAAAGVPGATSNQPPQAATTATLNAAVAGEDVENQSRQVVRNYEMDRTVSHTRQSVGRVKRLSIAVLVDHVPRPKADGKKGEMELVPLSDEELAKVESLVREAVGFDATRGDTLSVQNAPFLQSEIPDVEPLPLWERPQLRDLARQLGGLGLALALILLVLRPALRNLLATPLKATPVAALPGGGENRDVAALAPDQATLSGAPQVNLQQLAYEQKLQAARSAVTQDPKRVAQVVKNWVGQDG